MSSLSREPFSQDFFKMRLEDLETKNILEYELFRKLRQNDINNELSG